MNRQLLLLLCLLLSGGCQRSTTQERIVLTGSSTIAPLATELALAFEARHVGVRVDVQTGGSSRGILDARDGTADIGMVSRGLRDTERDLVPHEIARDGIAVIVHAANPVPALTTRQIVQIYRGATSTWDAVGGSAAAITVVNKAEGRSTLELFLQHFALANSDIAADVVIGDNEQGVKTVAGDPHAIAYVSVGTAEYDAAHGVPIRLLPLDGVEASCATVQRGLYPLSRPLNLITTAAPRGRVAEFIRFAQSEEADEIVRAQYFVPITH